MKIRLLRKRCGPQALVCIAWLLLDYYEQEHHSLWKKLKNPETVAQLQQFVTQEKALAYTDPLGVPPEFQSLFKTSERGDWLTLSNKFQKLTEERSYWESLGFGIRRSNDYSGFVEDWISDAMGKIGWRWTPRMPPGLKETSGETIKELYGVLESFGAGDEKYSTQFGHEIIDSIPPGSIYLGGDGPGRFIVTAMSQPYSHSKSLPIIAQNELRNESYLKIVGDRYGKEIYIPTAHDQEQCFKQLMDDIEHQVYSSTWGSDRMVNTDVNVLLIKMLLDKNPDQEFYLNAGSSKVWSMEWMNPHLEPHGLIFKFNRQTAATISNEIVARDHEYWAQRIKPLIGDWLTGTTTVAQVAAFVEKTYGRQDFNDFEGDPRFILNAYSQTMLSRPRSAIARTLPMARGSSG